MAKKSPMPGRPYGHPSAVEHIGDCVVCKQGIFSDQAHGRAPKPLLGKAHTACGGA